MVKKTLKTITGKLIITIPENIDEVTIGMMIDLNEDLTDVEIISVLSGIELDDLYSVRNIDDFTQFNEHILSLTHQLQYVYLDRKQSIPKTLMIMGKNVPVRKNLSIEPVGAFMNCRNIIADEINECIKYYGEDKWKDYFNPTIKAACSVLAHYLYCMTTGNNYNETAADMFEAEIRKLSITKALPIASYFFLSYPDLSPPKISYWHLFKQELKRKQALRNSRSSGTTTR